MKKGKAAKKVVPAEALRLTEDPTAESPALGEPPKELRSGSGKIQLLKDPRWVNHLKTEEDLEVQRKT